MSIADIRKKILLRAFAVFVLASAVWYGVFSLAAQSVLGTMIAETAVQMLVCVKGMTYKDAEELFKSMVADNKLCLGLLGCVVSAAAHLCDHRKPYGGLFKQYQQCVGSGGA